MACIAELSIINPLNSELNPICHLIALLAHHILHISRIRVNNHKQLVTVKMTVIATCYSLIQTIFMLFTVTHWEKHENYKVCCKSNETDFIYKKRYW